MHIKTILILSICYVVRNGNGWQNTLCVVCKTACANITTPTTKYPYKNSKARAQCNSHLHAIVNWGGFARLYTVGNLCISTCRTGRHNLANCTQTHTHQHLYTFWMRDRRQLNGFTFVWPINLWMSIYIRVRKWYVSIRLRQIRFIEHSISDDIHF